MKKAKLAQKKEMCWLQVGGGSEQTFGNLQLRCPSRRAGSSPVFLVSQQTRWKERKRRNNHRERKLRWWTRGKCSTWQSLPLSAFAFLPRSPMETFLSFTWWADHHCKSMVVTSLAPAKDEWSLYQVLSDNISLHCNYIANPSTAAKTLWFRYSLVITILIISEIVKFIIIS